MQQIGKPPVGGFFVLRKEGRKNSGPISPQKSGNTFRQSAEIYVTVTFTEPKSSHFGIGTTMTAKWSEENNRWEI